ncbi:MAG TPA: DinB family protein [Acidimicrobiales bacterium]|jgi:hypothetical protein|nr:DinB family protein [Acidimicrobiales bacterium]
MAAGPLLPDTKDWTWVLQRACPECGFDTTAVTTAELPELITSLADRWEAVLVPDPPAPHSLTARPSPDRWSTLEYGCHVRDVFRIFDQRLQLMLTSEQPQFDNWDQDATAVADDYQRQDPAAVAADLESAALALAARFASVGGKDWQRAGRRSDGAAFTVASLGRYLVHDPVHHLHDVGHLHGVRAEGCARSD